MPSILREALLARSTMDISSSSSADNAKQTIAVEKVRLEDFEKLEKDQSRASLSDLTLEEAAEVEIIVIPIIVILIIVVSIMICKHYHHEHGHDMRYHQHDNDDDSQVAYM